MHSQIAILAFLAAFANSVPLHPQAIPLPLSLIVPRTFPTPPLPPLPVPQPPTLPPVAPPTLPPVPTVPGLPVPELPVPGLPVPGLPVPGLPVPELPIPGLPIPELPIPELPIPELPIPELPIPELPIPELPIPLPGLSGNSPVCTSSLYKSPQCCSIDLQLVGLQCTAPSTDATPAALNAACASEKKEAKCCLLSLAGVAVLCKDA